MKTLSVGRCIFYDFIIICLLNLLLLFLGDWVIDKNELIYQSLIGQLEEAKINGIVNYYSTIQRWLYIFLPLIIIVKVSLVYLLLYIGMYVKGYKHSATSIMAIVLKAQYVVVVGAFITIFYFWFTGNYHTLEDLSNAPFSALSLFHPSEVEPWLRYPLSLLNIFEIFYWVALIVQWKKLAGKTYGESFDFVASTYGLGLLFWVLVVVFFTI